MTRIKFVKATGERVGGRHATNRKLLQRQKELDRNVKSEQKTKNEGQRQDNKTCRKKEKKYQSRSLGKINRSSFKNREEEFKRLE